jgi:hypothetical protein
VIVPMSTSTIEAIGPDGPQSDAENFGFSHSGSDAYPEGKLTAERFWLDWQSVKPGGRYRQSGWCATGWRDKRLVTPLFRCRRDICTCSAASRM